MSATFDCDLFGQYFAVPIRDRLEPAPVVTVEGRAYNVSEYYADDLTQLAEVCKIIIHCYIPVEIKASPKNSFKVTPENLRWGCWKVGKFFLGM